MSHFTPEGLICIVNEERRDILWQELASYLGRHTLVDRHSRSYREARIMLRALARVNYKDTIKKESP